MAEKRRGLGRGLGALIPTEPGRIGEAGHPTNVFFRDRPGGETAARSVVTTPTSRAGEAAPAPARATDLGPARGAATSTTTTTTTHRAPEPDDRGAAARTVAEPSDAERGGLRLVPGASFEEIALDDITPNARQPRDVFDEDDLAELAHSIREIGVLQPIVVRPLAAAGAGESPHYEIVMGERRWRASRAAGQDTVPAIVRRTDDDAMLRDALLENLHRSQLNPLEEAAAYQQLLEDFGCTHEELAGRIGRSRPQITNVIRLLRLPPLVARRVAAGVLSAGHARALLGLPDAAAMERLAQRIVAEGLSVRTVEEIVALGSEDDTPTRRRRAGARRVPELDDLAARLADHLDTRVSIAMGRTKGKMTVEFASVEDLNRILEAIRDDPAATPAAPAG